MAKNAWAWKLAAFWLAVIGIAYIAHHNDQHRRECVTVETNHD